MCTTCNVVTRILPVRILKQSLLIYLSRSKYKFVCVFISDEILWYYKMKTDENRMIEKTK